jgi:hypothetical protein
MFLEVKFEGGLGNQMFQYATGRSICIKNNIRYLLLNTESYLHNSLGRKFSLAHFNISGTVIKNNRVRQVFRQKTKLNKLASALALHEDWKEKNFMLHTVPRRTRMLTSVQGYWQSEFYFTNIRDILLQEFVPKKYPTFPTWMQVKSETVAVHVRRTDYLSESRYGFLGLNYYLNAIELIKAKVSDPLFIVFSDDILWCKKYFLGENFVFADDTSWSADYLQLFLMSKCKHQVIANSSFSWWSAWLNNNSNKIIVRPVKPFKDEQLLYQNHYPEQWLTVQN